MNRMNRTYQEDHVIDALGRMQERAAASGDAAFATDVTLVSAALRERDQALQLQREERAQGELQLRRSHAAIMTLARSESLSRGALDESLREITETASEILGVERSSVWVYDADQTAILCLELYQRSKGTHESGIELSAASFPGYFRALKEERAIPAHDAHTDPRTREFSESYLTPLGIQSMLDAPIRVGGRMIGVICNEHVGPARRWTIEEEQFAGSLADFIALAMESNQRKETEEGLRMMLQEPMDAS
jgi:transcriptional regulator with GAF, ATPase, and Fis domain